ncbi:OmpA family protein [Rhodocytophaga aerolata]|uniref:OmpA family protein n=1 Tax=Rhodocytophaga aerolata TaxID=455078 RepID=A0ABT8R3C0_9BACT|nr:OmpA family protein [Rhodocytophaga aerolata]MDO1445693.1 OmpA family protein [Rhodocytophaga aerolata]
MIKKTAILSLLITASLYGCNQSSDSSTKNEDLAVSDSVVVNDPDETMASNDAETTDMDAQWNQLDRNAPSVKLPEVSVIGLETRGNKDYTVYSMEESILFDKGQAKLRENSKETLNKIVLSMAERAKGDIRIYGYADPSEGTSKENIALSSERAMAVRNWLVENGNIDESRISVQPMGENQPTTTVPATSAKKSNRRVDIVAMTNPRKAK